MERDDDEPESDDDFSRGGVGAVNPIDKQTLLVRNVGDGLFEAGTRMGRLHLGNIRFNLLEGSFDLALVNAQHVKMVPGRKTDVRDSEWLAQLLELGLLRRSFVPPAAQRALRDVVRYRKRRIEDRAREANRVQKVLETANIKLASVVTDVLGVSARAMLKALIACTGTPDGPNNGPWRQYEVLTTAPGPTS
jgi:hypothetical protein